MSVATSLPCLKIPNPSSSGPSPLSSSSSSTTYSCFRTKSYINVTIRSSQAEGPVRRPVAPPPAAPTPPLKRVATVPPSRPLQPPPFPPVGPPPAKPAAQVAVVGDKKVVTLEYQRHKAKELQEYFKQKKMEEANQGPFFGFLGKNEIANGRWAMFGFAVGMLTEYATGSGFVDQVKILLSNFGIVDLE